MCGIVGLVESNLSKDLLLKMNALLFHRGPDEEGFFIENNVGLAMRRLSIIDLKTGAQPLFNEDKNLVLIFNGEIYNFKELKKQLIEKGHKFNSQTDGEVILHLYQENKNNFINNLRGMFAFALYDKKENKIILSRDEFGIKPLYYFFDENIFIFSSEIKSILLHPKVKREVNLQSLYHYLTFLYVPDKATMFKDIYKLLPGEILIFNIPEQKINFKKFNTVKFQTKFKDAKKINEEILIWSLENVLKKSIQLHLISDVPVGVFLSGGIDSSLIAALIKNQQQNVETFSVGFKERYFNELNYADLVASNLKTKHHKIIIKPASLNILPKLIWHLDEPLADASIIPNYYLSKFTSQFVKVALSGLGGDEVFYGYLRYLQTPLFTAYFKLPYFVKNILSKLTQPLNINSNTKSGNYIRLIKKFLSGGLLAEDKRYIFYNTFFKDQEKINLLIAKDKYLSSYNYAQNIFNKFLQSNFSFKARYLDFNTYLPNDLLFLSDRTSMANSLEVRVPFVDKEVVNFANVISPQLHSKKNIPKYLLRKLAEKYLPRKICWREKHGFAVPTESWFKKDLFNFLKKLFSQKDEFFNNKYLLELLYEHRQSKLDLSQHIFAILTFKIWYKIYIENFYMRVDEDLNIEGLFNLRRVKL